MNLCSQTYARPDRERGGELVFPRSEMEHAVAEGAHKHDCVVLLSGAPCMHQDVWLWRHEWIIRS